MAATDIFIKRPVFATVLSLIILLIGIRSYFVLPIRLFPKIDSSVVSIQTTYAGADSELMEGFVTTQIENALGGIDGIDYITSTSTTGSSAVTVFFKMGYDINTAVSDINSKVNSIRYLLPKDIDNPKVSKRDPNSQPCIYLAFFSDTISVENVTDYLNRVVQPQLQTLPGVGTAEVWGSQYAMRIWLNPQLMSAHNISPTDVTQALQTQSLQTPGGALKTSLQQLTIRTFSEANTAQQFNDIVIKQKDGEIVKIQDIGKAELGPRETNISVWLNGAPGSVIAITPTSVANPLDISTEVKKIFPQLISTLPQSIHAEIMWDSSKFIDESIKEVKKTVIEATIFVILVVFLFLGSWRTLLIPTVTIPLSLIGVCGVMYILGYTLNTITFLSMVLAIGMVVDDAIVVSENIHRHLATGKSSIAAAMVGAKEIQFAIIAMTLTLAAVYAPIGFLTGLVGALFKEFAFTLAGAVIISGFVALTLSPMMCSKFLRAEAENKFTKKIEEITINVTARYQKMLYTVLKHRKKIIYLIPIVLLLSAILYFFIPSELAPNEDQGFVFTMIQAPTSANIEYTEKYTKALEPILRSVPEYTNYLILNGQGMGQIAPNVGMSLFTLKPWSERKRTTDQIVAELFPKMWAIPGIIAYPMNISNLPGAGNGSPVQIHLQYLGDYEKLNSIAQKIIAETKKNWHLYSVRLDPKMDQPQLDINIDRGKAADLGVPISDIGYAINLALGQPTTNHFSMGSRSYDVVPQLYSEYSNQPDTLNNLYLHTATGDLVSLGNLISIKETVAPQSYKHFQQIRAMEINANTIPGYTIGQALKYFENLVASVAPNEVKIDYAGQSRLYIQTSGQMAITFIFAVIFIFLVLAAQFESFRDPLIVLFTIPLSTFGALLAMILTGCTMNIYSEIGLITLVGLISKHGILIVEFANQLRATGKNIEEAIIAAATTRLRPILMTTAAMILGALPLTFAHGAGAVSRQQIGWVIVGGMLVGTMFTLFVVPTMYSYLASKKDRGV